MGVYTHLFVLYVQKQENQAQNIQRELYVRYETHEIRDVRP